MSERQFDIAQNCFVNQYLGRFAEMKNYLAAAAIIAWGLALAANADDGLVAFSPLYKDSVVSNPGTEMVHPYIRIVDSNADGFPEASIRFNVYPMTSSTMLFNTSPRVIPFPALPCDPATTSFADFSLGDVKFQGDNNPTRSHMALVLLSYCADSSGYNEARKTVVYSASINVPPSDPTATVWMRTYPLDLFGFDSRYFTPEAKYALVLSLGARVAPTALNPEPVNLRSIGLEIENGAVWFDVPRALTR